MTKSRSPTSIKRKELVELDCVVQMNRARFTVAFPFTLSTRSTLCTSRKGHTTLTRLAICCGRGHSMILLLLFDVTVVVITCVVVIIVNVIVILVVAVTEEGCSFTLTLINKVWSVKNSDVSLLVNILWTAFKYFILCYKLLNSLLWYPKYSIKSHTKTYRDRFFQNIDKDIFDIISISSLYLNIRNKNC